MFGLPLFPESASTFADDVDALYFFLVGLSGFFSLLIAGLIVTFAVRFRRRHADEVGAQVHGGLLLEIGWSVIPFLITMFIFFWGAKVYFAMANAPAETLNIYVVGKQWMWKVQHVSGQREINELHIPVGRPVKLIMTSEDVIHDFSIPAFRVKADVIPGRFVQIWFEPTRPGTYRIFCAEYCGTEHSGMTGQVVVMEPASYQTWLSGGVPEGSLASTGEKLFADLACNTCHRRDSRGRGPMLENVFGRPVQLHGGTVVTADESYVRESILAPAAKVTAGFQPVMPAFQGLVSEEQLLALIEYIKSLSPQPVPDTTMMPVELPAHHYLNDGFGIKSWLLTRDHKRIALLYLAAITLFFFIGGAFAVLIRLELATPTGDLVSSDTYNELFTMHGIVMVFFFLIPAIPAVLGNFLVPLMIGAKDLAFPKLNLFSWYIYILGGLFTLYALITGGVDTGWTMYAPLSTRFSTTRVIPAALGIFITGFSSILTGLNFIVTIHRMRAPGMTWFKMPLFLWAAYATSVINILGTPVIAITVLLVAAERVFHFGFFDPTVGGDPVLFQHLFWFYSHPAVYIMVLPAMGVISELVAAFCRKPVFGYSFVAFSSLGIAVLGFLVWGHHIFVAGQSVYASLVFSLLSFLVAIPSAVKVFNWTATMYRGSVSWQTPMLYAIGFIGLFTIGGLTGLFLAAIGMDVHLTDTYFIIAHFHYIMVGGTIMGYLGGLHYWWPKISGRMYPEGLSKLSAAIIFVGFNLTFFPQFILGYLGMPRRYHAYPPEFQVLNVLSSAGASILGFGYLLPMMYLGWSLRYGPAAGANPWGASGLEWETTSPPPTENFATTPTVTESPYNYPSPVVKHVA